MNETHTIETGYVTVEGGRVYYEVAGSGHPLVLLHADVADHRMWDEQFATMAQHYRVVRLDKRHFGKTTSENVSYSGRQDIADLLKHLGIAKTHIMGLSNGGALAVDFTLEYPEIVTALVVVAGGMSGYAPSATPAEIELFTEYQKVEAQKDMEWHIADSIHVWGDGPFQPEGRATATVRERLREMLTDNYQLHHDEQLQPRELEPPAAGRLGEIQVPTLVIVGGLDFSGTIASMEYLAEHVAGAQQVVFPDTAHMVNMEQPARFNAVVLDFLGKL